MNDVKRNRKRKAKIHEKQKEKPTTGKTKMKHVNTMRTVSRRTDYMLRYVSDRKSMDDDDNKTTIQ